jgi:hypothetical protein
MKDRVPTFAFTVDEHSPATVVKHLTRHRIFACAGHFYAAERSPPWPGEPERSSAWAFVTTPRARKLASQVWPIIHGLFQPKSRFGKGFGESADVCADQSP